MIHFGHLKPTVDNQSPIHMTNGTHWSTRCSLFWIWSLMTSFIQKMKLNPLDEAPPMGFNCSLEKWIQSGNAKDVATEVVLLDNHYKYDKINNILLDVIDKELSTSFLHDDATRTITIICTTHSTKDVPIVWKGLDCESFFIRFFDTKTNFMIITCKATSKARACKGVSQE
jgi:hypothetical protein